MTNKETIDKEQFHQNLERFKIVLETRNFEIELFWKRCNYFLVLNTALAVGIFASFNGNGANKVFLPWICLVGVFVCFAWIQVGLGAKYWQSHWERVVMQEQEFIGFRKQEKRDYFSIGGTGKRVEKNLHTRKMSPFWEVLSIFARPLLLLWSFFAPCDCCERTHDKLVLTKPSVSGWMHKTAVFFFSVWVSGGIWALWKICT